MAPVIEWMNRQVPFKTRLFVFGCLWIGTGLAFALLGTADDLTVSEALAGVMMAPLLAVVFISMIGESEIRSLLVLGGAILTVVLYVILLMRKSLPEVMASSGLLAAIHIAGVVSRSMLDLSGCE